MAALSSVVNLDTIDLYSAAASVHGDGSLMVSPLSILYCSMLLYLGAGGSTKTNLESSFHLDSAFYSDQSAALSAFADGLSYFQNATGNTADDFLIMSLVNEIFVSNAVSLKPDYQKSVGQLQSIAQTKDFVNNPEQARQDINADVAKNTANTIQNLLPQGTITPLTVLVLVNTLYFKSTWINKFTEFSTAKAAFTMLNGNPVQVDMMHQVSSLRYVEDDQLDIQCVELPFYSQNASMLILLPRKTAGLRNLEKALTQQSLQALSQKASVARVDLSLPKFTFTSNYNLIPMLKKIGVSEALDKLKANFTAMVTGNQQLYVSDGIHQTFISVDEKGTEASAATAIVVSTTSVQIGTPVSFKADHPFLFLIRNNPSKAIMFIGRVESF
ncbi:heterochromatin-associated protein MENT-like [Paramacrobiotus metropolitanus]|uniref:heterochromatin-associated protein MENT-like n=1 Tax=Paramacrobiotus metropolitanus TaxID=2943436 RepID=UPI00244648A4|nr:heterochromatin-associated protein MENT-like [Paramacrobiotus metropolitanus]